MSISLPQFGDPAPRAGCGTCTACCVIPSQPDLGKPFYARCYHLVEKGCGIYDQRPDRCRAYRCAWHMGILGDRTDRRPDEAGVLFQFDRLGNTWTLGIYELTPGAANTERTRYLRDIILKSKKIRHFPMSSPAVRIVPFGADIAVDFPVSPRYDYASPAGDAPFLQTASEQTFAGKCRELLVPKNDVNQE